MPEGDTVWLTARLLDEALAGQVLVAADLRVPRHATADLSGRTVLASVSRGKHLLTRLSDGLTLHSHLGMEGSWRIFGAGQRPYGGPGHQVRAVLQVPERRAVGYRLRRVDLVRTVEEQRLVGHLGPDLLGPDWDVEEAVRRLRSRPERPVGEALLDQRNLAGIGNLYKAEVLFRHRVDPWLPVGQVPDLAAVVTDAQQLLQANRHEWRQVTTGSSRRGEEHWVFERAGRPCRRCGTPVSSALQGQPPQQRISYWCRRCQPGPAPARARSPRTPARSPVRRRG